jgi:hypothetical protein
MAERIEKIVSGGQTGVDRGGLDAALALGIPCGGWCPRGRRAEDGTIPDGYPLVETETEDYLCRTEWNVRDSDATLILNEGPLEGGTKRTLEFARKRERPCLVLQIDHEVDLEQARVWLVRHRVRVLNIAGPRESKQPGIAGRAANLLESLLS